MKKWKQLNLNFSKLTKTQKIIAVIGGFIIFAEIIAYLGVSAFREQKTQEVISGKAKGILQVIEINRKHAKLESGLDNSTSELLEH